MKKLTLGLLALFLVTHAAASVRVFDNSDLDLGHFESVNCPSDASCSQSDGRLDIMSDARVVTVSANTTATSAQCGATFANSAAGIVRLPEASTVQGCEYTFVTAHASSFNIRPGDRTDRIVILAAAGDSIYSATVGNSIKIKAVGNDVWAPVGKEQGTWTAAVGGYVP